MQRSPVLVYVEDDIASIKIMKLLVENVMKFPSLIIFEGSDNFMEKLGKLPETPDLFLLDIHMKPYDGFEILSMLRAEKHFKKSKIIAVTASVMGEEIEELKKSGFDGALAKPLDISSFPESINRILRGENVWVIS